MGQLIYGRTRSDVKRWPSDPAAQMALGLYLDQLPPVSMSMSASNLFNGDGLDLSRSDVSGLFLEGASLNGADLTSACVSDVDLYTAWMISADLRNADFSRSDLRKVEGRGCSASGGIFCDARLQSAVFEDSDFRRANLVGADLRSASFADADLGSADLRGCEFSSTDFSDARMGGCSVAGASGSIIGPVDVGVKSAMVLAGLELKKWFSENGAVDVTIRS